MGGNQECQVDKNAESARGTDVPSVGIAEWSTVGRRRRRGQVTGRKRTCRLSGTTPTSTGCRSPTRRLAGLHTMMQDAAATNHVERSPKCSNHQRAGSDRLAARSVTDTRGAALRRGRHGQIPRRSTDAERNARAGQGDLQTDGTYWPLSSSRSAARPLSDSVDSNSGWIAHDTVAASSARRCAAQVVDCVPACSARLVARQRTGGRRTSRTDQSPGHHLHSDRDEEIAGTTSPRLRVGFRPQPDQIVGPRTGTRVPGHAAHSTLFDQ